MTLIVRARIEVDKGSAQADLKQTADAVKGVGDASRDASAGTAALTVATGAMTSAQREAAQAVRSEAAAQDEATRAKIANTAAAGRQRAGYQQLGFQVQDVFQQFALGINPLVILAQQGGQVTSAFALMGSGQEATQSKFTRFMTFLSGPYGAAVLGAVTIGGLLIQSLRNQEEVSNQVTLASDGLAEAQSVLSKIFDTSTGAIKANTESLRVNAQAQAFNLKAKALADRSSANTLINGVGLSASRLFRIDSEAINDPLGRTRREQVNARALQGTLDNLRRGNLSPTQAFEIVQRIDFTGLNTSQIDAINALTKLVGADESANTADKILKSLDSGVLDPDFRTGSGKSRKPKKDNSAEKSAREAQRLLDFTDVTAERIQRINEQFDEQPRLIDQAAKASRELDSIQADVERRLAGQPDKIKEMTAAIASARAAVDDALLRPFREMEAAGARQLDQLVLLAQGRDAEAEALQRIAQYQARNGQLTEEQRQAVLAQVEAERELNQLIDDRGRQLSIYNASIDDTRAALENLLSGGSAGDFLKSLRQNFQQLQGRLLTEQIFGGALRELEEFASGRTSLKAQTERLADDLAKPGEASTRLAGVMDDAADRIARAADRIANPSTAAIQGIAGVREAGALVGNLARGALATGGDANAQIVVQGKKGEPVTVKLDPTSFQFIQRTISTSFKVGLRPLEDLVGTKLFNGLADIAGGAFAGYAQAGPTGAVLGALKSIEGLPDNISKALGGADGTGGAFGGAVAGFRTSAILDALGVGNSKSGAALGGALGSALPIPGGEIIGSIAGGLIGGPLKSTKRGSATITSVDGDATSRGNSQERINASLGLAGGVQQRLRQIAEEFDAQIGSFAVSIGVRKDKFRVDTSGQGKTKTSKGAVDFGDDEEAAIAFALRDAISDGAIKGLSAAIQKALNSNPDVDKAIAEALKVRDVEDLLAGIGGEIEKEVREFERQANERTRIAREYGFDVIEIERINAEKRASLIEDILKSRVGALQDLLNDLVFGDLAEGTLSERRQRLLSEIEKAESEAERGQDGAADRLAELNRRLIELSRDAYGTAGGEYASDRAQAIASAERIIAIENDRIRSAQEAAAETNRQLATGNQLSNEANNMLAQIDAGIRNLVGIATADGSGGGSAALDLAAIFRSVEMK